MSKKKKLPYKDKLKLKSKRSIVTRISVFSILSVAVVLSIAFIPKSIINKQHLYQHAVKHACITEKEDIALYKYKVYSTQAKYEQGLIDDVNFYKDKFKSMYRILLIKYPGEEKITYHKDYISWQCQDVPEKNIEFYAVKNTKFKDSSFPVETFVSLASSAIDFANKIYLPIISVLHVGLFTTFLTLDIFNIKELEHRKHDEISS